MVRVPELQLRELIRKRCGWKLFWLPQAGYRYQGSGEDIRITSCPRLFSWYEKRKARIVCRRDVGWQDWLFRTAKDWVMGREWQLGKCGTRDGRSQLQERKLAFITAPCVFLLCTFVWLPKICWAECVSPGRSYTEHTWDSLSHRNRCTIKVMAELMEEEMDLPGLLFRIN